MLYVPDVGGCVSRPTTPLVHAVPAANPPPPKKNGTVPCALSMSLYLSSPNARHNPNSNIRLD